LIQVNALSRADVLNFPAKLNAKLSYLAASIASADGAPSQSARNVYAELAKRVDAQLAEVKKAVSQEVEALNTAIRDANLPPVGT
jgi:hypothetical protein